MSWFTQTLSSSIGRKLLMALTGIFLILFLTVHLIGNLQLITDPTGKAFNIYAHFMGHNPLIKLISIGNFAFILLHIVVSIILTRQNKIARGQGYAENGKNSAWNSRNMGALGTILLIFLIVHLKGFWAESKFGGLSLVSYDGQEVGDLYSIVAAAYAQIWYTLFYVACMLAVAFHLHHGFQSAFQTLGLNNKKYTPLIKGLGFIYSILIPALYAVIPIWMYLNS